MSNYRLARLTVALVLCLSPVPAADDDATTVATRIPGNLTKAWERKDGRAYAAEFWPDAEFINVFGGLMKDQHEIASRHDFLFNGPLKDRKVVMTIRKMRMLAPT